MLTELYAEMALICGITVAVLMFRIVPKETDALINRVFKGLLGASFSFCIVDACWGYFATRKVATGLWPLFLFSYLVYALSGYVTFIWFKFTINYFHADGVNREFFKSIAFASLMAQWAILITNFINPEVFSIAKDLSFTTGKLRLAFFGLQEANYLGMFLISFLSFLTQEDKELKRKAKTAILFSLIPLLMVVCQFTDVALPAYSVGFMLSCVTIYAYVISEEREKLLIVSKARELEREHGKNQKIDFEIINRLAADVDYIGIIGKDANIANYRVDGLFEKYIDKKSPEIHFTDFDVVMRKLLGDKNYLDFSKRASKEIVINRLKVDKHYTFIVNFSDDGEEYQYRTDFFSHPYDINSVIMSFRNITEQLKELQEKEEAILRASIDGLTGLLNKSSFEESVNEYLSKHGSCNVGFIFIDLDKFKEVNDSMGHAEGDKVLQDTADRLRQVVRKNDLVSRQGGDEFCIFIPAISKDKLEEKLQIMHETLKNTRKGKGYEIEVSASIGCVFCTDNSLDYSSLRAKADESMYNVKKAGRDNYQLMVF